MPEDDHASLEDDSRLDLARMRYRAALFFVITCVLSLFLLERTADHRAHEAKALAAEVGHAHLRLVSERLNASFSATYALAALVRQGRGQIEDFTRTAGDLLQLYPGAAALQLAPGGVIREVVPLLGNERAIGHDLLADPQRSGEALLAVETRKLTLAGPFELMQGGLGAVARLPVFVPQAGGGDRFWGFTTVLVRFPEILAGTGLERLPERGYDFALWRTPAGADHPQIIQSSGDAVPTDALELELGVPNGRWMLSLAPRAGWVAADELWLPRLGVVVGCALLALFLYGLMVKPLRLQHEVALRTRALRDSEERFRTVVHTIPDLIWLKSPDGVFLGCNRRFEDYFGAPTDEILGKTDQDFVAPDLAASFRENDRRAIEADAPTINQEWITFASDGHRELLETIKTPVRDSRGTLIGVLGVGRDISELARLAERHRASEARLADAQRVAGIGSWERDLDTDEVYWSAQIFELFELDPELITPAYEHFLRAVHPDDRERVHREYTGARTDLQLLSLPMRLQMPDGRVKHLEMRAHYERDESGQCRRIVGTLQDVTQRWLAEETIQRQEALTRAMLTAMPVGVAITDPDGVVIDCNEAACHILFVPRDRLIGHALSGLGLVVRDAAGAAVAADALPDRQALREWRPIRDVELSFAGEQGRVDVAMSAVPVTEAGFGVVIALVDLAAQKHAAARLREDTERIDALNRRFSLAADAAGVGVWELDSASRKLVWDDAMLRLHGLAARDFDGTLSAWVACVQPPDRARVGDAIERALRGEEDLDLDFRVQRRSADIHFVRACARVQPGADGMPLRLIGVCLDMTTLKRSEQILIQERRRYRDLVDSTDGIVWEADAVSNQFTYVSKHAERLLGYPIEEWYEPEFWPQHVHPEDRSWAPEYSRRLTSRLEDHEFEYRMIARDGRVVWLRDIVTVLAEAGVPRWIRGVMVDITEVRRTAQALAQSREQLSLAIEGAGLGLWDWDIAGGDLDIGAQGLAMLGFTSGDIETRFAGWEALIHPDDLARVRRELVEHLQGRSARFACEYRLRHKQPGRWVWVHALGQVMAHDSAGVPLRAVGIQLDITERRIADARAREARAEIERLSARNALILRSAGEGIFGVDVEERCMFINPVALQLLGISENDALQQPVGAMFEHRHEDGRPYLPDESPILATLRDGVSRQFEDLIARRDGKSFTVRMTVTEMHESGERVGVEVVFQDISERRAMERELKRLATTDPLTGVTNRRQFMERCEQELVRSKRFGDPVSLLMIDVDHFKRVNDNFGHAAGDAVLRHLSALASGQLRRTDVFARLGGEEFAFLLAGSALEGAMDFATRFRSTVEHEPARTEAGLVPLTISIGAAQADPRDRNADDLLRRADAALYRAKDAGRNRVEAQVLDH